MLGSIGALGAVLRQENWSGVRLLRACMALNRFTLWVLLAMAVVRRNTETIVIFGIMACVVSVCMWKISRGQTNARGSDTRHE